MDRNEDPNEEFSSQNDRKVQGQTHVCPQNAVVISTLKLSLPPSMFSGDLMDRGTPVLHLVALAVCLNVVTHVTIAFRSGTGPNGAKLK